MSFALRPEGPEFLTRAPLILRSSGTIAAARPDVFAALTGDPAQWRHWFPGFRTGGYDSAPPHRAGAKRWVRVAGAGTYRETIVTFDEPRRWAWRVDTTTVPLARALVEDWTLGDAGDAGTRVTWTFAADPYPWFDAGLRVAPSSLDRIFATALRRLERLLA